MWMLGNDTRGGLIRRWSNSATGETFHSPVGLSAIGRSPDGYLWAVGRSGATLRLGARELRNTPAR
jgi:hypothetical protein